MLPETLIKIYARANQISDILAEKEWRFGAYYEDGPLDHVPREPKVEPASEPEDISDIDSEVGPSAHNDSDAEL